MSTKDKKSEEKLPPLEQGLQQALKAIDKQVARDMQRSPGEREVKGVQKWDAYSERIERIVALVLNSLGDGETELDSLLVMSQGMVKAFTLALEDLGRESLGDLRSGYCSAAVDGMTRDLLRAATVLRAEGDTLN